MNDNLNYNKFKTIIYCSSGYYGSKKLWNDASYAFRTRFKKISWNRNRGTLEGIDTSYEWQYLTNDRKYLAEKLEVDINVLPEWDYEYCELQ